MSEHPSDVQNVYSDPKDKEKKDRPKKQYYKNYEERETREKEDQTQYDSDGFEIISTNKTKPEGFIPKRKYEGEPRDRNRNYRGGKRGGKKPEAPREKSEEKDDTHFEEQNNENVQQPETPSEPVKKVDKETIILPKANKLKDLFK